ncbi:MAG: hypothetical protein ACOC2W_02920 [bacterium]
MIYNKMYCPLCEFELGSSGSFRYEDVCGPSYSQKFVCKNEICTLSKYNSYWNDSGDFFSGDLDYKLCHKLFPTNKFAAYNSFSKKAEVEIYKHGLEKNKRLHPGLCLWFLQPMIEYYYKSDDWGNVIDKSYKIKFLRKSKNSKTYNVLNTFGFKMVKYMISEFKQKYKNFKLKPTTYNKKDLLEFFDKNHWDKRWWRRFIIWYFNTFYKRAYLKIKNYNG